MKRVLCFSAAIIGLAAVVSFGLGCIYDLGAEAHAASLVVTSSPAAYTPDDGGFLALIMQGKYMPAVGIALTFVVSGLRLLLVRFPFFRTKKGKYLLGFGSAALLYLAAAWQSGSGVSVGLFATALGAGWTAAGGWEHVKDVLDWFGGRGEQDMTDTTPIERPTGSAGMSRVMVASIILVALVTSCATAQRAGSAGKHAVIECGKQDAPAIASLIANFGVRAAIAGKVDVPAIETAATGAALGVGTCALAEFLREYKRLAKEQVAARGGEADLVVELQAALARVSGGATVRLTDGTEIQ